MNKWEAEYKKRVTRLEGLGGRVEEVFNLGDLPEDAILEIERFDRVYSAILSFINNVDYEVFGISRWPRFDEACNQIEQQITSFIGNRAVGHLSNANNQVDIVYDLFKSFVNDGESDDVSSFYYKVVRRVESEVKKIKDKIEADCSKSKDFLSEVETASEKIKVLLEEATRIDKELRGNGGYRDTAREAMELSLSNSEKIRECFNEIMVGDENTPAIKQQINTSNEEIEEIKANISSTLASSKKQVAELKGFYVRVFGDPDNDDDKGVDGEIQNKINKINDYESQQQKRHKTLSERIEGLLPGATSAGLASAYHDMRASFDKPIDRFNFLFYVSIGVMVVMSFVFSIESLGNGAWITFKPINDWNAVIMGLVSKLPVYLPVLWIAMYASKRRSEAQRLQQEYAHKEALANPMSLINSRYRI